MTLWELFAHAMIIVGMFGTAGATVLALATGSVLLVAVAALSLFVFCAGVAIAIEEDGR